MKRLYRALIAFVHTLADLPPLIFRLVLAYGFYEPAMQKAKNFDSIVQWFGDDLHIPFPLLNAYMAVATECAGVALMILGLATRLISVPMMVIMLVAIATVHYQHGFAAKDNGFEIPFYYLCMLFSLFVTGPGRISVDYLVKRKFLSQEAE